LSSPVRIEHADDPRLDDYRHLRDADLRRAIEAEHGLLIAEGPGTVRRLLASGLVVRSVLLAAHRAGLADELGAGPWPVYVVERDELATVAGFDVHRGVLAAGARPAPADPHTLAATARRLLVVEGITDGENLGALFRNAAAFGVDAVLLDPTCADPLARRPVRVSVGHALRLPHARLQPWPEGLHELGTLGFTTVALTPDGDTALDGDRFGAHDRLAFLVGAEGGGLSTTVRRLADHRVRIPMADGVDSLNVATATAIALWATTRNHK
jgi:tRNA G18 (ribose-2'-O)-methylase SpoU